MGKVKCFVDLSLILRMLTPCIFTKLNNKLSELSNLYCEANGCIRISRYYSCIRNSSTWWRVI